MQHYGGQRLVNMQIGLKLEVRRVKKSILICHIIVDDTNPLNPEYKVKRFPMGVLPCIRLLSKKVAKEIYIEY